MTSKTILLGLVAIAFVAGSIMTGTMAEAKKDKDKGNPFQVVLDAIAALQISVDSIETSDTSGLATQASVDALDAKLDILLEATESTYEDTTFICYSNPEGFSDCTNTCDIDGSTFLEVISYDGDGFGLIGQDGIGYVASLSNPTELTILCEKP